MAVIGIADGAKPPLLAIGDAKWNDTMGMAHVDQLRYIRALIALTGRYDTTGTWLIFFSGAGFNDKAYAAAAAGSDVQQIDLATLYGHSNAARTDTRKTASGSRAGTKCQIT